MSFRVRREDAGGGERRAPAGRAHVEHGHLGAATRERVGDGDADYSAAEDENLHHATTKFTKVTKEVPITLWLPNSLSSCPSCPSWWSFRSPSGAEIVPVQHRVEPEEVVAVRLVAPERPVREQHDVAATHLRVDQHRVARQLIA